jgi:hypothetical protein
VCELMDFDISDQRQSLRPERIEVRK